MSTPTTSPVSPLAPAEGMSLATYIGHLKERIDEIRRHRDEEREAGNMAGSVALSRVITALGQVVVDLEQLTS